MMTGNLFPVSLFSQEFTRIQANFSISDNNEGAISLIKGQVFYDLAHRKLVFRTQYPYKKDLVFHQTLQYVFARDSLQSLLDTAQTLPVAENSLFHLCLTNSLESMGLKGDMLKAREVEAINDSLVVTHYLPRKKYRKLIGKVDLVRRNAGDLYALILYSPDKEIAGRYFFRKFQQIDGFSMPGEIIQIIQLPDQKVWYRKISLENIILNAWENDDLYNYPLPF